MTKRIRKKKHKINTNIKHNTISNSKNDDDFIMQPKVDYCFKELMKDTEVLKGFLSAILDISPSEIKSIDLLPTELQRLSKDDKLGKCIHIGILNFNLFEDYKGYYSRFHISEDTRDTLYSDKLEIHILELAKLQYATDISKENSPLYNWCKFFTIENKKELDNMYGKNEYIDKACDHIVKLSADEMKKLEYDQRFKALCDYNTQMHYNYNKGKDDILLSKIKTKLSKGKSLEQIADELEEPINNIKEYIKLIKHD